MERTTRLLFLTLEQLAIDWKEAKLPQEILLTQNNVDIIMTARALVDDPGSGLTMQRLRSEAPTFLEQAQLATMRNFEELPANGAAY